MTSIKSKVIHGLKWSALSKLVAQLISWVSTFLVINLLVPNDFAVLAVATAILGFVNIVASNGFSSVIVKEQALEKKLCNQVFTLSFVLYSIFAIFLVFVSDFFGKYFDSPELPAVLTFIACSIPLNAIQIVPLAHFNIKMHYKEKGIADALAAFGSTVVCLSMAFIGYGVWSLAVAKVVELVLRVCFYLHFSKVRFSLTKNLEGVSDWFSYLFKFQTNSFLWYAYNRVDTFIVGKFLGMNVLGVYNIGVEIASIPSTKLSAIMNQVGFAAFSKTNKLSVNVREQYFKKAMLLTTLLTAPIFLGVAATANEFVQLFLDVEWYGAISVISIFCFIFPIRMNNSVLQTYLNSNGKPGENVKNSTFLVVGVISGVFLGLDYGLVGVAIGWVVGFLFGFSSSILRAKFSCNFHFSSMLFWLKAYMINVLMYLSVTFVNYFELSSLVYVLVIKVLIGLTFVSGAYWIFFKKELLSLIKK